MNKKIIYIKGMHCVACEKLLDDEFRNVSGVKDVKVDRKANRAEIFYDQSEPSFGDIKKVAKKFGYDAFETDPNLIQKNFSVSSWIRAGVIFAILLVVFRFINQTGIINKIDFKTNDINLGVSFLVGLVASLSSCLAIVGAVVIAFAEKYKTEGTGFYQNALRPNLLFHAGRLATFFVLGGVLGALGGELSISGSAVAIFTMLVAGVMFWLGLNILGIVPSISSLGLHLPKNLTSRWNQLKKSEHEAAPFLLGGLSFFLPCGFTQSMQIFALTSGSFWTGGLTLLVFALGTVPSLLILGTTASWTKSRKMETFQKVAGLIILFFAFYTFQSGWALRGVKTNLVEKSPQEKNGETKERASENNNSQEQTVEMHITRSGFEPSVIKLKKGIPVKWVIKGDQVTGCTNKIIVPEFNLSKSISYGENVVKFIPKNKGEIPFSCWMGMVRGKFIVE